ncbi:hypothetical protein QCA50_021040 [Cerrena zonata]|uniref:Uncharacterized protein n=1 Tax=Cerrena zonata TaxID=2478898 RepID=A0AAW0F6Y3_9APHY
MSESNKKAVRFTGLSSGPSDDTLSPSGEYSSFWYREGGPFPHLASSPSSPSPASESTDRSSQLQKHPGPRNPFIPDLNAVRTPSPIEAHPYIPDLGSVRSPSPIETRPVIPNLDPIEAVRFIPDLSDIHSPSPIETSPVIPDLDNVHSPSPIDTVLFIPDLSAVRSPSPIPTRTFIPDLDSMRSPSPIDTRTFIPDLSTVRSPSPIPTRTFIPDLNGMRSPSPIDTRLFIPDLSAVRSPSPIDDHSWPLVPTSTRRREPSPSSSTDILSSYRNLSDFYQDNIAVMRGIEDTVLIRGMNNMSLNSRSSGSDQGYASYGRVTLIMDEMDLFFWSVTRTEWFGPNLLPTWRKWAKKHEMTIKLMEDLLDYPQKYSSLFKNYDVDPRCELPTDESGCFILPPVEVDGEEAIPRLRFILTQLPQMIEKAGFDQNSREARAISQGSEMLSQDLDLSPQEAERVENISFHLADQMGRLQNLIDMKEAILRQTDVFEHRSTEAFVNAWSHYLRGAAGVPELRMMETRSIVPSILNSNFETPYPDIPPHPSTNLPYADNELDDTDKLISNMTELSSAIGDLRNITSHVFGNTRYENFARQR